MKIKTLYENDEPIDINSYLTKCGVEDVEEYLKHNTVEDSSNYENIDKAKELLLKYVGGDVSVK